MQRKYIAGLWQKHDLRKDVKFKHSVKSVTFNDCTFSVIVKDLVQDTILPPLKFDYIVNCTGHFATPHVPSFDGIETFPGLVMHAHDVKHAENFKGN